MKRIPGLPWVVLVAVWWMMVSASGQVQDIRRSGSSGSSGGAGDVVGPASSTDNAIVRYDLATGKLIQDTSGALISDNFALTLSGATVTASEPVLNLSQTWNNAGVTFTGLKYNVTDTASAAASLLMDLQVGGATKASIFKSPAFKLGDLTLTVGAATFGEYSGTGGRSFAIGNFGGAIVGAGFTSGNALAWNSSVNSFDSATIDLMLTRDAAATLQLGADAATATAQQIKAHDGSGTDKAGADFTIAGGRPTGTGTGGSIYLATAGSSTTGSSLTTLTNRLAITPRGNVYVYDHGATPSQSDPTLVFATRGTNWGFFTGASSVSLTVAGNERLRVWNDGYVTIDSALQIGSTDLVQDSTAVLQMGADAATATAQTIKAHDGSGTDKDGANFTFAGGKSTGTGRGGNLVTQTSLTSTTGSSVNNYSTRSYDAAKPVDLTESVATTIVTVAVAAGEYASFSLFSTAFASDGTDHQALGSRLNVNAVNKAGTVTATITAVDGTTAASAGTLTCTYTAAASGNNVIVQANAVSSLSQTILRSKWCIDALNGNGTAAITAP